MKRKANSSQSSPSQKERRGKNRLVLLLLLAAAPYFVNIALAQHRPASAVKPQYLQVEVLETYPHNPSAYTQGLFFHEGVLYESCGQYGESSFRKVDYRTGRILEMQPFDRQYFLEGSCVLNGYLYLLTWRENVCFVYDLATMNKLAELHNPYQGWGLTTDGKSLIMSDGSSSLYFMNPQTFMEQGRVQVTLEGRQLDYINELEYIDGKIWANVYTQDYIVVIDPETGVVEKKIDCSGLISGTEAQHADVLNGIAVNEKGDLFLTGKYWPKLFRVAVK